MLKKYSLEDVEFEVPENWIVGEIEGVIEILDDDRQGALHLSILKRTKTTAPSEADARLLVESFATNNGLISIAPETATIKTTEARFLGFFRPSLPTEETPLNWMVASVVWPHRAVRCSYCTDLLNSDTQKLATAIIDSVRSMGQNS